MVQPDCPLLAEKRCRASGPKTRTGCLTCRQRRVKCDEWRPSCLKCRKSGLACRGYESTDLKRTFITPADKCLIQLPLNDYKAKNDALAIEFYSHVVAPHMAGWQCNLFWKDVVVQLSSSQPLVRHSLICLSHLYHSICNGTSSKPAACEMKLHGLNGYNMAICNFCEQMQRGNPVSITLTVCLVLISIELLTRKHSMALMHYTLGLDVLQDWENRHGNDMTHPDHEMVTQTIRPVFYSLRWMVFIVGQQNVRMVSATLQEQGKQHFESLMEATIGLHSIIAPAIDFAATARICRYQVCQDEAVLGKRADLLKQYRHWYAKVKQSAQLLQFTSSTTAPQELDFMVTCSHFVKLGIEHSLDPSESVWDQHQDMFAKFLRISELMIGNTTSTVKRRSSHFRLGFGLALLVRVALKCRWPGLRRKAVRLLRHAHRRECFVDSIAVANLCEQVITIEEECFGLEPGREPRDDQLPPEAARVHRIDITPLPLSALGTPVNFMIKADGLDGPWHLKSHYVQLGNLDSVLALNSIISLQDNNARALWNPPSEAQATLIPEAYASVQAPSRVHRRAAGFGYDHANLTAAA